MRLFIVGWQSDMCNVYNDTPIEETFSMYFDEHGIKDDIKPTKLTDLG